MVKRLRCRLIIPTKYWYVRFLLVVYPATLVKLYTKYLALYIEILDLNPYATVVNLDFYWLQYKN